VIFVGQRSSSVRSCICITRSDQNGRTHDALRERPMQSQ
jgi:hypothetical protein